jgi:hypothetical protein
VNIASLRIAGLRTIQSVFDSVIGANALKDVFGMLDHLKQSNFDKAALADAKQVRGLVDFVGQLNGQLRADVFDLRNFGSIDQRVKQVAHAFAIGLVFHSQSAEMDELVVIELLHGDTFDFDFGFSGTLSSRAGIFFHFFG